MWFALACVVPFLMLELLFFLKAEPRLRNKSARDE